MAPLCVPEGGVTLHPAVDNDSALFETPSKPPQVMRLNLAQKTAEELLESLLNNGKALVRFGKNQSLHFGEKSQRLYSYSEQVPSELYLAKDGDKENMYFSGLLSHKLEVEKAKEATTGSDHALATLEQSLNAYKEQQALNTTQLVTSSNGRLSAQDKRGGAVSCSGQKARSPLELRKDHLMPIARSTPSSPYLGSSRSPAMTPSFGPTAAPLTSVPQIKTKDQLRLDALKVPVIHLLAVRPVSAKYLAQKTRASKEDCTKVLLRHGLEDERNRENFKLKDKSYKELDVWKFPYISQGDRQEAVNHAISAFDRIRLSKTDKLWQLLLRKEERGKGIHLSRLNLGEKATPKFDTHLSVDGAKGGYTTGNETDGRGGSTPRPAGSSTPSRLQEPLKKKVVGEKESQAKTTVSKKTEVKKTDGMEPKGIRKATKPAKTLTKFKSAEIVENSDEEIEMIDAATTAGSIGTKKQEPSKPSVNTAVGTSKETTQNHNSNTSSSSLSSMQSSDSLLPNPRKSVPRSRTGSSPQKPSPLGSSPPTNASEFETSSRASHVSSTSSSPYITQAQREKPSETNSHQRSISSLSQANGVVLSTKRKGDHRVTTGSDPKRQKPNGAEPAKAVNTAKAVETSGQTRSTVGSSKPVASNQLKRKAETFSKPSTPNGHPTNGAVKRPKSAATHRDGNSSDSSLSPPRSLAARRQALIERSSRFRTCYDRYKVMHDKVAQRSDPRPEDVDTVTRMHERVTTMKKEIWEEHAFLESKGA